MGFIVSPNEIVPFESLSTTVSVKSNTGEDASGTDATNTRGLELQTVTLFAKYMRAAGVDPRLKFDAWSAQVGKVNPLYIGGKRFGPEKMMLKKVEMTDLLTNNRGEFLSLQLNLTFEEYATTKPLNVPEQKKALNTTASNSDRSLKKVTGTEIMPTTY
jgi:hypothetical protein